MINSICKPVLRGTQGASEAFRRGVEHRYACLWNSMKMFSILFNRPSAQGKLARSPKPVDHHCQAESRGHSKMPSSCLWLISCPARINQRKIPCQGSSMFSLHPAPTTAKSLSRHSSQRACQSPRYCKRGEGVMTPRPPAVKTAISFVAPASIMRQNSGVLIAVAFLR